MIALAAPLTILSWRRGSGLEGGPDVESLMFLVAVGKTELV